MLISRGNTKLGSLPSFSLPVIVTCPGKTPFCERYCYGLKGRFTQEKLKELNDRRLDATLRSDFVDVIIAEIRKTRSPAFRLHVVGDFYSVEYINKWIDIATQLSKIMFFGSTRSWRCEFLHEAMKKFRDLPNVFIKASVDVTDNLDPFSCGWRVWSVEGIGTPCPHDYRLVENCAACGKCWSKKDFDLQLKLRWGKPVEYFKQSAFI